MMQSNLATDFINHSVNTNNFSFDGGIKLGYQYYFDKEALGVKQAYGINTSLYLGAGIPINGETYAKFTRQDISYIFKASYIPIKVGLDIKFLWDFLESGEHTLGLSAGIGYRFSYYKNIEAIWGNSYGEVAPEVNTSNAYDDMMIHAFLPQIGLHYYYGNHQFEINCKFGVTYSSDTEGDMLRAFAGGDEIAYKIKLKSSDYLSLGYSYRF